MPGEPNSSHVPAAQRSEDALCMCCTANEDWFLYPLQETPESMGKEGVPREQKTSIKIALSSRQAHEGSRQGMCRKVRQKLGVL